MGIGCTWILGCSYKPYSCQMVFSSNGGCHPTLAIETPPDTRTKPSALAKDVCMYPDRVEMNPGWLPDHGREGGGGPRYKTGERSDAIRQRLCAMYYRVVPYNYSARHFHVHPDQWLSRIGTQPDGLCPWRAQPSDQSCGYTRPNLRLTVTR